MNQEVASLCQRIRVNMLRKSTEAALAATRLEALRLYLLDVLIHAPAAGIDTVTDLRCRAELAADLNALFPKQDNLLLG
jgi:hypothetical protein